MYSINIMYCLLRWARQRIVTDIEKLLGVKIFHLLFGAIRLLEYILLIMEQTA